MKLRQADRRSEVVAWERMLKMALCCNMSQFQIYQNFTWTLMADNVSIKFYDWYTCRKLINWSESMRDVKGTELGTTDDTLEFIRNYFV